MQKVTGNADYKFGDLTKGAVRSLTGKEEYKFGDITKSFLKAWKVGSADGEAGDGDAKGDAKGAKPKDGK